MKRLAWIAILVLAVEAGAYFWLTPYAEPYRVYRSGDLGHTARGWGVLSPWAAWPVLAGYSAPLLVLIVVGGGWRRKSAWQRNTRPSPSAKRPLTPRYSKPDAWPRKPSSRNSATRPLSPR